MCEGSQESDSSQTAKKDMLAALRARQEALEETLKQRLEELKNICIREAVRLVHKHTYIPTSMSNDKLNVFLSPASLSPFLSLAFFVSPSLLLPLGIDREAA